MKFKVYIIIFTSLFLFMSCDIEAENDLKQLKKLQKQQQDAHLEKKPELLTELFADNFTIIESGKKINPTKSQSLERFKLYFNSVEFLAWENIDDPVIRVSEDGTMAYILVHKRVHLQIPQQDGTVVEEKTIFAWLEVWEKKDGVWKMNAIASTDNSRQK